MEGEIDGVEEVLDHQGGLDWRLCTFLVESTLMAGLHVFDNPQPSFHEKEGPSSSILRTQFESSNLSRLHSRVSGSFDKINERFQHALAMLAGIVTPPLILGGSAGANLDSGTQQYLISASLIVCGILSSIQITRFHIYKTPYYLGTGLIRFTHLVS